LDDVWRGWLGSIQVQRFRDSNFVIVAIHGNEVGQNNLATTEQEVLAFQYALLLNGRGYCSGGVQVSGNTQHELHVGPISSVLAHPQIRGRRMLRTDRDLLLRTAELAMPLLALYRHPVRFMRIRRGLASWARGIQEINPEPRLHHFVRAIEALTRQGRSGLTRSFCLRAQLFIGEGKRSYARLKQLYDLRSCIEHVKWWRSEIYRVRGLNVHDTLLYRALEAELVASFAYLVILSSHELQRWFSTERTIAKFWELPEADQRRIWGNPIDMTGEANRLFLPLRIARRNYDFLAE
jgi:hypothetical protein